MADKEPTGWITVGGKHIPLGAGEDKAEAIKKALNKDVPKKKNNLLDDPYMKKAMKKFGVTEKDWNSLSNNEKYNISNEASKMEDRAMKKADAAKKDDNIKAKQISDNKKEAEKKNAEEKQKNEDQRINKAEKNMQKEIKENGLADRYKKYTDEMHKLEKEKQPVPDRLRNELSKIDKEVAKLEEKHDIPIRLGYDGKIDVNRDLIRNAKEEDDDWRNYSGKNRNK